MNPGAVGSADNTPRKATEQQLNRACEACRLSKVRCLVNPNPNSGSNQCQRCAKAGRQCVFAPPAKRRQRKRTDVRVAELEKEIKQMRSLLKPNSMSPGEASDHESMDEDEDDQSGENQEKESPTYPQSGASTTAYAPSHESSNTPAVPNMTNFPIHSDKWNQNFCGPRDDWASTEIDIIDRGLISQEDAEELLDIYRNELTMACPGVLIPPEWNAITLRAKKPVLFHAVMAAASHSKGASLSNRLHEEAVYLYAKLLFIKGEKSLQYIQALLVTVSFYTPPNSPTQLQIYQYGNMAASMALELGLASKPRTHEQLPKRAIRSLQKISSAEELLENCRTILALYVLTAGFAMRLRRPNILFFNSWMEECLVLLQKSPLLCDKRMVAGLLLQRIADEAMTAFGFDDASTSFSLSELRLQVILRIFERRMQDWRRSVPKEVMTLSLQMEAHQNMISMWEFAMDGGIYSAPDFRNRHLTLPALDDDCIQPESLLSRSALQINATIKVISEAHSVLGCFLQFTISKLQKAPNVIFVRSIYALVALMKVDYAVGTDAEGIGEVLDSQSLKVDYYLYEVMRMTEEAIGSQKCRVPSHWLFVLNHKLKSWHDEHQKLRTEGKHLKKNDPEGGEKRPLRRERSREVTDKFSALMDPARTSDNTPTDSLSPPSTTANQANSQPTSQPVPNFGIGNAFPPWPTTDVPLSDAAANQAMNPGQNGWLNDANMPDFSAAFQNGDLYLWNDINDGFTGGWIPQGDNLYSDMQLGGLGGIGGNVM